MALSNGLGVSNKELERYLTPQVCGEVVTYLHSRGWTKARIAKITRSTEAAMDLVWAGGSSFRASELIQLAKAEDTSPLQLLFDAMEPAVRKSELRGLWKATREHFAAVDHSEPAVTRKPVRRQKARAKAA